MKKNFYDVSVVRLKKIADMPGSWSDDDYRHLLTELEVDGLDDASASDLTDMTVMALQDMVAATAAEAVLSYKLCGRVSAGSRRNIVEDLLAQQRAWQEVSDIRLHSAIYSAAVLLRKTFPGLFDNPDMMRLELEVTAVTTEAAALFSKKPEPAFVTRMLADAMSENSILEGLFDEQLLAKSFPEACGIVWRCEFSDHKVELNPSVRLTIYSSRHWLKAMESVSDFKSSAYNDSIFGEIIHG